MDGYNFQPISGLEKLSHDRTVNNSAEKACRKLFKPSHNYLKLKLSQLTNKITIFWFLRLVLAKELNQSYHGCEVKTKKIEYSYFFLRTKSYGRFV